MTQHQHVSGSARTLMLINALIFIVYGAAFLVVPEQLVALADIAARSPSALADIRAVYGGLSLAAGALFVLGLRRDSWFTPSLFLVAATSGGLALGRTISIVVSGMPSAFVLVNFALELVSFVWALAAYRGLGPQGLTRAAEVG